MDYLDVVVHVFTPRRRDFYRLEQLWGEVPAEARRRVLERVAPNDEAAARTAFCDGAGARYP